MQMTEKEITKMMMEFSKGLTLWGSNRVVKKWLKYRKTSLDQNNSKGPNEILFQLKSYMKFEKMLASVAN